MKGFNAGKKSQRVGAFDDAVGIGLPKALCWVSDCPPNPNPWLVASALE
ncbi:MAG: hypothetical protein U0003_05430 [Vampirovibrionales bacterium]